MFNYLANQLGGNQPAAERLLQAHPAALSRALEEAWFLQLGTMDPTRQGPIAFELQPLSWGELGDAEDLFTVNPSLPPNVGNWEHLIYAYFIENTGVVEVFRRILAEHANGEKLPIPDAGASSWLHATEDLFFRDNSYYPILNIASEVRPDRTAIRRNAYYRLFGIDLDHPMDSARTFAKADASNRAFIPNLEHLLRQAWIARIHFNATVENPTDVPEMRRTWRLLSEMMRTRKRGTRLVREEFVAVAMMSWFHLTLFYDTAAVHWLTADAESSVERLARIASLVAMRPNPRARHYFDLAPRMSVLLRVIEAIPNPTVADVQTLYTATQLGDVVAEITNLWSLASGRELKAMPVAVTGRTSQQRLLLQSSPMPIMAGSINSVEARV